MKRFTSKTLLALTLIAVLLLSLCAPAVAAKTVLSTQKLTVDGKAVDCEKYNIDGNNYFKLRDLAELLNGTESQFDVDYDAAAKTMVVTTGAPYTHKNGTELKAGADNSASAVVSPQTLKIDGETVTGLSVYNIGGNNYFKLRDLGKALHFYVHYDEATKTMLVDAQEEDEDWETGDASKDNPRNADGIGETEVLVVSFGTSFNDSRVATIGAIENAMEKAFPGYSVRRGFTANIIIDHVYRRDDEKIDDITEALDRAVKNGVKNLLVQPTHLMHGFEYDDVIAELAKYTDSFENIVVGAPLLTDDADYDVVIKAITEGTKQYLDGQTAICFMGHGTEHEYNFVYSRMQEKLTAAGYKDYFVGTVEATPTFQDVVDAVKAAGYKKVILEPLMIVAGDHANNDMADPEDPESWYSMFVEAGIQPTVVLKGLGEFPEVQQLLVEHLKEAAAEALDEDYDTGDASKDNPRNADGIGEKELLVVSFGTSFNDSRVATIGAIENALEKAFPAYSVRRGFTANIIIDHVLRRDGEKIDDITEALDRAVKNGVKELVVQPTHLMHGYEYDDVIAELAKYSDSMDIKVSEPLLTSDADYDVVIKAITEGTKQYLDGETAICFMGHGTEHEYNFVYSRMQEKLTAAGYKDYFVGTVEATPTFQDVVDAVKAAGYKKVILEPLMIVAGDHANNDMADPEDPESWYSMFVEAGIQPTVVLKGLGEFPEVQQLFVEHTKAAIGGTHAGETPAPAEETAPTSRDLASKTATRTEVLEDGMVAVPAAKLNDGTYSVKVKVSSTMFPVAEDATLTVKDGKATAVLTMTGEAQNWLFMGEGSALAAAAGSDLIPLKDSTFTIPVEAVDAEIILCSYSKNRDAWYERSIVFRADSLPEAAFAETQGTDPASLNLADGEYTVAVALAGGSGKTSVASPAKLVVAGGKLTASVVFSSNKYDYMLIGETRYEPTTTDPGSTFEIPVTKLDSNIAIIAHTTAMGGQEISYTLNFDSASIVSGTGK